MFKIKEARNHTHIHGIHGMQIRSTKKFFHGLSSCKTSFCVSLITVAGTISLSYTLACIDDQLVQ